MRRRHIARIFGALLVVSCVGPMLLLSVIFRVNLPSPWLCFSPTPSEANVVRALRYGPGDGATGVGDDGLIYRVQRIECARQIGVATPKMNMHLRVYAGTTLLTEGTLRLGLDQHVVIFAFVPDTVVPATVQDQHPAVRVFLERYNR